VRFFLTWLGLLGFLALTVASSCVPMGAWNSVANLAISCAKGVLIAFFFMELRAASTLVRIVALVGVLWLGILFGLSWSDYGTRTISPAPWLSR
jgi:cytochrome c oxidase subunit 4